MVSARYKKSLLRKAGPHDKGASSHQQEKPYLDNEICPPSPSGRLGTCNTNSQPQYEIEGPRNQKLIYCNIIRFSVVVCFLNNVSQRGYGKRSPGKKSPHWFSKSLGRASYFHYPGNMHSGWVETIRALPPFYLRHFYSFMERDLGIRKRMRLQGDQAQS